MTSFDLRQQIFVDPESNGRVTSLESLTVDQLNLHKIWFYKDQPKVVACETMQFMLILFNPHAELLQGNPLCLQFLAGRFLVKIERILEKRYDILYKVQVEFTTVFKTDAQVLNQIFDHGVVLNPELDQIGIVCAQALC